MMMGNWKQWQEERIAYSPTFARALEFVSSNDFSNWKPGKYPIDGDEMFAVVAEYDTKESHELKGESHLAYIDVQCVLSGVERIAVSQRSEPHQVSEDLSHTQDAFLYNELINAKEIEMNPGDFAVFFPHDIHKPGIRAKISQKINKVVVKIKIS